MAVSSINSNIRGHTSHIITMVYINSLRTSHRLTWPNEFKRHPNDHTTVLDIKRINQPRDLFNESQKKCVHAHHEVATPIPCKLDQWVPKSQINTRVSRDIQQAQFGTRTTTANTWTTEIQKSWDNNEIAVSVWNGRHLKLPLHLPIKPNKWGQPLFTGTWT